MHRFWKKKVLSKQIMLVLSLSGSTHHFFIPVFFIIGKVSSFEEEDGTGTGRNEVRIKLSRGDLGSQFTCQAENEAIDQPLSTSVQVDVNRKSLYYIFPHPLDSQNCNKLDHLPWKVHGSWQMIFTLFIDISIFENFHIFKTISESFVNKQFTDVFLVHSCFTD